MGPTRGANEDVGERWVSRAWAGKALKAFLILVPIPVSLIVTALAKPHLPRPPGVLGTAMFIAMIAAIGFLSAVVCERQTRRMLPLAGLLSISLTFPDQAPSRYKLALRAGGARKLKQLAADVAENGVSEDVAEAANQLLLLVEALRLHEPLTRGHTERVRAYAVMIGEEMGLSKKERDRLHWGSLLHDVGKLQVPAEILTKDGRPTEEEWQVLKSHPAAGAKMVQPLAGWLGPWIKAAGEHHERWDGGGYPNGLSGTQISLAGRIVAVADAYDVITSTRSYKKSMSADAARAELARSSGSQFDPSVVRAMLDISIGRQRGLLGRFAWMIHIPAVLRPVANVASVTASNGAIGVAALVTAAVATGPIGPTIPERLSFNDEQTIASSSGSVSGTESTLIEPASGFPSLTTTTSGAATSETPSPLDSSTSTETTTTEPTESTSNPRSTIESTSTTVGTSATITARPTITVATAVTTPKPTTVLSTTTTTTITTTSGADCAEAQSGSESLQDLDLGGCDLAGLDLAGANLQGANLQGANLSGANVAGAKLHGADLGGADLTGANLAGARLQNANLAGVNLTAANLALTILDGVVLTNANLAGANFAGAEGQPANKNALYDNTKCPDRTTTNTGCW